MHKIFGFFLISLLYLEAVYHIATFGLVGINPMLMIPAAVVLAAIEAFLVGFFRKRNFNIAVTWVCLVINFLLFVVQLVYFQIFTRPLLLETAITTGGQALTDFWSVALDGIFHSIIPIIFMLIPFVVAAILMRKNIFKLKRYRNSARIESLIIAVAGVSLSAVIILVGYSMNTEFYEEYQGMYAPEDIAKEYGMLSLYERQMLGDLLVEKEQDLGEAIGGMPVVGNPEDTESESGTGSETESESIDPGPVIDTSPNVLNIDFTALMNAGSKKIDQLAETMQAMTPSKKNEYTGMFEGYNLIYLTAEGFSQYAVSEELTPTLYKMINSGIVVKDYYIPLWQTSTSDGEYVNLFGQIPDGQHSFRRSQDNKYPYSLPAMFEAEGVKSYAYHNNSLSYYDRYITHPNIGYDFKAARLGSCSSSKYGDKIFKIPTPWPASDYDMMVATVPEWINEERFHAYYMTVSGHAAYTWIGNKMSSNNKDAVAHLDCSEEMKAYIACNLELEKAMAYLVEQLELAGKLDNTLIVLSADHYPYGFSNPEAEMEAVTGTDLSALDMQKNSLIMWNSAMETINVEKTCSAMDILPTIYNLFGFDYDSRLFPGKDMLSDSPSLVVFSNRSFITDSVIYDASKKKATSRNGEEISDEYLDAMKSYVKALFTYSAGILNNGFDEAVHNAQIIEPSTPETGTQN